MPEAADLPLLSLTTALGAGLLIGLLYERRKDGDPAIAAGLRTHTLAALAGAIALWIGLPAFIAILLLAGTFAALSYLRTSQTDTGITAEIALLCSVLLGGLAMREPGAAGMLAVLIAILIQAKARLHHFSREVISNREIADGLVLLAFALIVLPLLPDEPIGPYGALNLATVWKLVVLVMAVGALGHVALRLIGSRWGLLLSGFFSGYVSSTAATAGFGQRAKSEPALLHAATGATMLANLASLSLFVPILLAVAPALLPVVALPLLAAGAVLVAGALLGVRRNGRSEAPPPSAETRMFRIGQAIGLAALIAGVLVVSHVAAHWLGPNAALATAFLTALAELQAATATVATLFRDGTIDTRQAQWAVVGLVAASSIAKSVVAFVSGGRAFGLRITAGLLAATAAAAAVALLDVFPS
ncbi:MgtC/SapB family protein [Luteimonas viscosa]|uniref:MgtC/SapB family protein n=1 Tax=Luteimonas viscosa TaxID=1132694 RepID=A0A5D4XQN6_9GAMM|nr:DUF4010 domain-containing protein [Luteimonas viscosa]TYT26273.1 MgtC/SapB family protein [Luteimonas viscosa]